MILLSLALSRSTEFRSYTFRVRGEWQVTKWQSMLVCFHRSSYIYILIEFFPSRWYFINMYLLFFSFVFYSSCLLVQNVLSSRRTLRLSVHIFSIFFTFLSSSFFPSFLFLFHFFDLLIRVITPSFSRPHSFGLPHNFNL